MFNQYVQHHLILKYSLVTIKTYIINILMVYMAQIPALIPKEVEIQRLKKIWLIVIAMGSTAASVEVDNFVDGSLHQTSIRDSAFTPAHWWLYSHFIALPKSEEHTSELQSH